MEGTREVKLGYSLSEELQGGCRERSNTGYKVKLGEVNRGVTVLERVVTQRTTSS